MHQIKSIIEYLKFIEELDDFPIFRGQSQDWPLIPKIGRNSVTSLGYEDWQVLEDDVLARFIREVSLLLDKEPIRKIDWIILGQHYGLPTRLLDWTTNPLKALFFACNNDHEKDGFVFLLCPNYWHEHTHERDFVFDHDLSVYYPKMNTERISQQEGCFTIYPLPENVKVLKEVNKENFPKVVRSFQKIRIPSEKKKGLISELNLIGINHKFIFGGIEGVCNKICYELDYKV